jgi:hypothetical protein
MESQLKPTWTLDEGLALCRKIQELPSQQFSCHPALTGGLLYKDGPRKDCDIVIYQRGDVGGKRDPIDWKGFWKAAQTIGLEMLNDFGYVKKCFYQGKSVDVIDPTHESDYPPESETIHRFCVNEDLI